MYNITKKKIVINCLRYENPHPWWEVFKMVTNRSQIPVAKSISRNKYVWQQDGIIVSQKKKCGNFMEHVFAKMIECNPYSIRTIRTMEDNVLFEGRVQDVILADPYNSDFDFIIVFKSVFGNTIHITVEVKLVDANGETYTRKVRNFGNVKTKNADVYIFYDAENNNLMVGDHKQAQRLMPHTCGKKIGYNPSFNEECTPLGEPGPQLVQEHNTKIFKEMHVGKLYTPSKSTILWQIMMRRLQEDEKLKRLHEQFKEEERMEVSENQ